MPLRIFPKTFGMAREERQLQEILSEISAAEKGDVLLFPEYGAYTIEGSQTAYAQLSRAASSQGKTIITSLNLPSDDLPNANPTVNYNTLFIFSRNGQIYSPQAKITPQSFETRHLDETFPKMNVTPYSFLNRITLRQNGEDFSAYFFICSDLYALQLFDWDELESDAILCPANFGNGAEGSAEDVIDYTVKSGLFKQGFLCNTYQDEGKGRPPLTRRVEKVFKVGEEKAPYRKQEMNKIVARSSVVYPDDPDSKFSNFQSMLQLTQKGTFTVPRSRSLDNGLKVELGAYENVIEL
ncbi:hypothetical protein UR09_01260 [Candidatus Nitromaritima sp. SCGC AAA799-A02]|nr:hypothetical protein UZ36_04055 [Candidatus Nitromaritima sp. SCGC AAA799-C22]KMP12388.1 hypothetical protein UR09_01260 [Candidatus Nitromaritima sp. SCGC AAA799-A02]